MPRVAKRESAGMLDGMRAVIRRIPRGRVATYGQVAAAAGHPGAARQVVWALRSARDPLPWHRVLGAGGVVKLPAEDGFEQRLRLESEGVRLQRNRVDLLRFGHHF